MYFRPRSEFKKQSVTVASGSDALINKSLQIFPPPRWKS